MKFYISYFYAVRFMKPQTIPLSTAVWDPFWFYKHQQGNVYVDKNGVMNGLRATPFVPIYHGGCEGCDKTNQSTCKFMQEYRKQLKALDFNDMMKRFESIAARVYQGAEEPEIVLLVHEAPNNPCSERWVLFDWFKEHNIEIQEYPLPQKKANKSKQIYRF